jgi:hypothetical protein
MSDFNITLFEACELLNKSKKSISRYIRRGLLHPDKVKSQQGTLEYRFSKADIEAFKAREVEARPDRTDQTGQTRQTGQKETISKVDLVKNKEVKRQTGETGQGRQDSEVITLLKETTGLLKGQLQKKDEQIKDLGGKIDELIMRDKETHFLMGQLQSKVLMLEAPKTKGSKARQDRQDGTGQDKEKPAKASFWKRLFK